MSAETVEYELKMKQRRTAVFQDVTPCSVVLYKSDRTYEDK